MTQPVASKPRQFTTGQGVRLIFVLQIAIAIFLIGTDLASRWQMDLSRAEPAPTGPVAPGDQVRRYDPSRPTPQFSDPRTRPNITMPPNVPSRLEFTVENTPETGEILVINGAITQGDDDRFAVYLDTLSEPPQTLAINSPGGNVDTALAMGRLIRAREFDTLILPGTACLSSCPYMLAGGVNRQVSLAGAVGLHQHYYETPGYMPVYFAVADIQRSQGQTMTHLIDMGIDAGVMVYGLSTPPDDIYVLVEEELVESRLATEVLE